MLNDFPYLASYEYLLLYYTSFASASMAGSPGKVHVPQTPRRVSLSSFPLEVPPLWPWPGGAMWVCCSLGLGLRNGRPANSHGVSVSLVTVFFV